MENELIIGKGSFDQGQSPVLPVAGCVAAVPHLQFPRGRTWRVYLAKCGHASAHHIVTTGQKCKAVVQRGRSESQLSFPSLPSIIANINLVLDRAQEFACTRFFM